MAGYKQTQIGVVLSDKMDKTIVVEVSHRMKHRLFKKYHLKRKKYKVHDDKNQASNGQRVLIREGAPVSKQKRWILEKVL